MDNVAETTKHRKLATILSIIPGLGQIYHRQFFKGLILLIFAAAYFVVFANLFNIGLWGIWTLGTKAFRDDSLFLMVKGIIALLVIGIGLGIYVWNLYDAYQNGKKRDMNLQINSIRDQYRNMVDSGFPYLILSPGFFLLIFTVIFPILFVVLLAFTDYNFRHAPPAHLVDWVGLTNFIDIFKLDIWRQTFIDVFSWTIIWTLVATTIQIAIGIFLAVLMNQKDLKFKKILRTIFILPWAVPAFVSILVFAGMFNDSFGAVNQDILAPLGIPAISWLTDPTWTKTALIFIQSWLGFPFVFAMVTGVLQAIPEELYEAATVDGASLWQKFRQITLPMVLYAIAPILITQYTFNFNNFNVIYLFNGGGPAVPGQTAGSTDILISWVYSLTFDSAQYAKAAAITMILSVIVIGIALWQFRRTKSFTEEDMM